MKKPNAEDEKDRIPEQQQASQALTSFREEFKDIASIVQSVLTCLAIVIAGIWFLMQGMASPKANISHSVTHRQISDSWIWLRLEIIVKNEGKRPLHLKSGIARVQRILPLEPYIEKQVKADMCLIPETQKDKTVFWPQVGKEYTLERELYLEAGETDTLECEFMINSLLRTIKIQSEFQHPKYPDRFWRFATIYDLQKKGE